MDKKQFLLCATAAILICTVAEAKDPVTCSKFGPAGIKISLICGKDQYCCGDGTPDAHCCTPTSTVKLIAGIIGGVIAAIIAACCICCICCPFCILYKRRHRGTVYSNVPPAQSTQPAQPQPEQPSTYPVHPYPPEQPQYQPQPYPPQPYPPQQTPYPPQPVPYPPQPYPPQQGLYPSVEMPNAPFYPTPAHGNPPPYSEAVGTEMYQKQAPYNPNY